MTLDVEVRLRRELAEAEEEKLNREIRSVAPTISNAIITTRATSANNVKSHSGNSGVSDASATSMTNEDNFGPIKPTEHEIVYYKTCLACREQQDLCKVLIKVFSSFGV